MTAEERRKKHAAYQLAYYYKHHERLRKYARAMYYKHRAKRRANAHEYWKKNTAKCRYGSWKCELKRLYGLTPDDLSRLKEKQRGRCAICRKVPKKLHVDHNHATGAARALLCTQCNSLLGYAFEKVRILRAAIAYVKKHAPRRRPKKAARSSR